MQATPSLREIYASVDDVAFAALELHHHPVHVSAGKVVHTPGGPAHGYICLTHGLMRAYVADPTGRDQTTEFFEAGHIAIDIVSLFLRLPSNETIMAVTDCHGFSLSFDSFQQLFHQYESIREWGRTWMTQRHLALKQRITQERSMDVQERYLALVQEYPNAVLYASQRSIASYLGVNESTLSRVCSRMHRRDNITRS